MLVQARPQARACKGLVESVWVEDFCSCGPATVVRNESAALLKPESHSGETRLPGTPRASALVPDEACPLGMP